MASFKLRWYLEGAATPVAENADGTTTLADNSTYYAEAGGGADDALQGSVEVGWVSLVTGSGGLSMEKTNDPTAATSVATSGSKWSADAVTALTPNGTSRGRFEFSSVPALKYRVKCAVGASAGNGGSVEGWAVWKTGR